MAVPSALPTTTPIVAAERVSLAFSAADGGLFVAVRDCELHVQRGEFLSLVGPSGCGKSTLLFAIDGLYTPVDGRILVNGAVVTAPRPDRAMVFQEFGLLPWRTVRENVEFPLELAAATRHFDRAERTEVALRYIRLVGLGDFQDRYPHQLSGGMKQRVGIARAFACGAEILLMDEPFAAVDAQTRDIMGMELLRFWEQERKTIIFVTHSIDEAVFLGDRVAVMTAGPTHVKEIVNIPLPRPRDLDVRGTSEFAALRQHIWESLKVEVLKNPQFAGLAI